MSSITLLNTQISAEHIQDSTSGANASADPLRLFVALPLPEHHQRALQAYRAHIEPQLDLHRARWVPEAHAHLTVHFLGNLSADTLPELNAILENVRDGHRPFSLHIKQVWPMPTLSQARMLWVRCAPSEAFNRLARRLQQDTAPLMPARQHPGPTRRPPQPHITLVRFEPMRFRPLWLELLRKPPLDNLPPISVHEFQLWRSDLTSEGAVYHHLARFPLSS